jgi:hypothetical protein
MPTFKLIGKTPIQPRHRLTCHCGSVVLELELPDGVENPRRCNCSLCSRRGAINSSVALAHLHIVQGQDCLSTYRFNTMVATHYFCSKCGIYTHHQRRSDPLVYGYNVACLEGVDVFALGEVPTSDGRNHVCDRAGQSAA